MGQPRGCRSFPNRGCVSSRHAGEPRQSGAGTEIRAWSYGRFSTCSAKSGRCWTGCVRPKLSPSD
jgi:hypothetical protein